MLKIGFYFILYIIIGSQGHYQEILIGYHNNNQIDFYLFIIRLVMELLFVHASLLHKIRFKSAWIDSFHFFSH